MRHLLIALILLFYIFFFVRSYSLSKSLGKNIKAKNLMLNMSILFAAISSLVFVGYMLFPRAAGHLFVLYSSHALTMAGSLLIASGLIASSLASLTLRKSWRIGIDESEKTELITRGIYRFSRNPYFLSYDLVLAGMVFCMVSPLLIAPASATIILFHCMILREERYLEKQHGDSYLRYKKEVRRYL